MPRPRNANPNDHQNPDREQPPRRDRTGIDDVSDTPENRRMRNERRIDDPRVDEERHAPGAENAEDELDDEDYEHENA